MFKPATLLFAAALLAGSAYAQTDEAWPLVADGGTRSALSRAEVRAELKAEREAGTPVEPGEQFDGEVGREAPSTALRYKVRVDIDKARASGSWPVYEYDDGHPATGATKHKAGRRPRKEYPNVMGISLAEWLASRQQEGAAAGSQ